MARTVFLGVKITLGVMIVTALGVMTGCSDVKEVAEQWAKSKEMPDQKKPKTEPRKLVPLEVEQAAIPEERPLVGEEGEDKSEHFLLRVHAEIHFGIFERWFSYEHGRRTLLAGI